MLTTRTKLSLLIPLLCTLTACQHQIGQTASNLNTSNSNQKLTAHDLMKNAMLHRFDKSYDYQKTTKYQTALLYDKNDLENQDVSVFLSVLQAINSHYNKDESDKFDPRPERLACETNFGKQYNQTLKKLLNDESSSIEQANAELDKLSTTYEQCLSELPALPAKTTAKAQKDIDYAAIEQAEEKCLATYEKEKKQNNDDAASNYLDCIIKAYDDEAYKTNDESTTSTAENTADNALATLAAEKSFKTLSDNSSIIYKKPGDDTKDIENSDNADFTTINSIIDEQPSVYQTTLKSAIEKLNKINQNNQKVLPIDGEIEQKNEDGKTTVNKSNLAKMLANLRLTQAQIDVINQAYLSPQTISYQGSFDHVTGQFSTVVTENSETTYTQAYKRVPMLLDMNEMSVVFEPDVVLPFASFIIDKELPDVAGKSVKFTLPENLRQNIPLPMIKDSLIKAIGQAYGDIDSEKVNELVLDDYAKSIHASRVVKVNLSSHDVGFIVGRGLKYFTKYLKDISTEHPEYIKDNENFKVTLEFLESLNKVYRAEDLAKLAQLVETVIPLSFNSFNYYYFDNKNQLIGYRRVNDYRSGLFNAKAQSVTTSTMQYHDTTKKTSKHRYYQPEPSEIIDGNALFKDYYDDKKRQSEAQDARFGYLYDLAISEEDSTDTTPDSTAESLDDTQSNQDIDSNADKIVMPEQQIY